MYGLQELSSVVAIVISQASRGIDQMLMIYIRLLSET